MTGRSGPDVIGSSADGCPMPSTASGSAPSSSSSASIAGRFLHTAKCTGVPWFSLRLKRLFSTAGFSATIRRISSARFSEIAEKM